MSDRAGRLVPMVVQTLPAVAVVALATGCSLLGRRPSVELYRLATAAQPAESTMVSTRLSGLLPASIAVAPYTTPGVYRESRIVYRVDEPTATDGVRSRYSSYPYREWAVPLGEMLGMATEEALRQSPVVDGPVLYEPATDRQFTYHWRGRVVEFEEVDRGRTVLAAVRLDAQLVRAQDDSVVWSGSRRVEIPVQNATAMTAVVEALSTAARDALRQLALDAKKALPTVALRDSTARP